MGAYASKPHTDTQTEEGHNGTYAFGASTMQGWRLTQEDAHVALLDFDDQTHIFGVFDGHGGAEVAQYAAQCLPEWLKELPAYKAGEIIKALTEGFVTFDKRLTTDDVINKLKELKGIDDPSNDEEEREEAALLVEEATMPIEDVVAKYDGALFIPPHLRKTTQPSPFLKARPGSSKDSSSQPEPSTSGIQSSSSSSDTSSNVPTPSQSDSTENGSKPDFIETKPNGAHIEEKVNGKDCVTPKKEEASSIDTSKDISKNGESENSKVGADDTEVSFDDEKKVSKGKGKQRKVFLPEVQEKKEINPVTTYEAFLQDMDSDEDESDSDNDDGDEFGKAFGGDSDSDDEEGEEDEEESEDDDEEEEDEIDEDEGGYLQFGGGDDEPGRDSGCTAVVAVIRGDTLYVANAGDSRCVVSDGGKAIEMSLDHKPEDDIEVTRIRKAGGTVTSDGRVNGGLNLSRALGDHTYKDNKSLPLEEQMISPVPDVKTLKLQPSHDFMVLACDGIWNSMSSQEVVDFVRQRLPSKAPGEICEDLFQACLAPDTSGDGTGCDNMTAIIISFDKNTVTKVEASSNKRKQSDKEDIPERDNKRSKSAETDAALEPQPSGSGTN